MAETTIRHKLLRRWAILGTTACWRDAGLPACHDLLARYADPRRAYHNQQHLLECIEELDRVAHLSDAPADVEIALWFHDAVYDPKRTDNESMSADLAAALLAQVGDEPDRIARVRDLILDTAHRAEPSTRDGVLIV